jgi:hypothetical protein
VRRTYPKRPSAKAVRNALAVYGMAVDGVVPTLEQSVPRKRGKQKESLVNDAVRDWARVRNGELYRNRRGMVQLATGAQMPIGLGPNGSGDMIGWMRVRITPDLVGRTLPIYCEIESKTQTGILAPHQQARIEYLRDLQAIAGCARSADDCEEILRRWADGYAF